jgi:peroxiredoxin
MVSSIIELDQRYRDQLVVIGIDADEGAEAVRAFVDQHDLTYLSLIGDAETLRAYRLRAHPLTLLIDPERHIYRSYLGYTDKENLERDIQALVRSE